MFFHCYCDNRGESVLLFLVQTVGRQAVEQRQFRAGGGRGRGPRKQPGSDAEVDAPDHDLEPPRFARRALLHLLGMHLIYTIIRNYNNCVEFKKSLFNYLNTLYSIVA